MARSKDRSAARRPRRYAHDPHHPGLARGFARWAQREGLEITRLSEEQRIVLEAVRRFLAWSGPRPLFVRLKPIRYAPVPSDLPRSLARERT